MSQEKPNCYKCEHRGTVPGSCHSSCKHPAIESGQRLHRRSHFDIVGVEHGIRKGWFNWPWDFDPVWLEMCEGYTPKEGEVTE